MTIYYHYPKYVPIIPDLVQYTFSVINNIANTSANKLNTSIDLFQMQNTIRWWKYNMYNHALWVNISLKTKSSDLWSFWSNVRNPLNCSFHLKSWISIYKEISSLSFKFNQAFWSM